MQRSCVRCARTSVRRATYNGWLQCKMHSCGCRARRRGFMIYELWLQYVMSSCDIYCVVAVARIIDRCAVQSFAAHQALLALVACVRMHR